MLDSNPQPRGSHTPHDLWVLTKAAAQAVAIMWACVSLGRGVEHLVLWLVR